MPKMTVRVILKSGVEFFIKCDKFTLTRNGFQQVTGYNIEGITENKPVYLDFEQVAAVVRVFADEKPETDDTPEEYRNGHGATEIYFSDSGKPEGIPTELADVIIRVLDYCGYAGIDIDAAISQKHEYNKSRPYRHGGKKC